MYHTGNILVFVLTLSMVSEEDDQMEGHDTFAEDIDEKYDLPRVVFEKKIGAASDGSAANMMEDEMEGGAGVSMWCERARVVCWRKLPVVGENCLLLVVRNLHLDFEPNSSCQLARTE